MAGKKWTAQQETELKALVEGGSGVEEIAAKLQKSPGAVIVKCQRLSLPLQAEGYIKTSIYLPKELPSIEEALKILAGALKAAAKPGLDKVEVQRLQATATIAKIYKEMLASYINYREIEAKLEEMEKQNAQLLKERSPSTTPQPDTDKIQGTRTEQQQPKTDGGAENPAVKQ